MKKARIEIVFNGLVQGVGFRYFVYRHAEKLGLDGYVKNLYNGEVYVVAEGEKHLLEEFYDIVKIGPSHAHVRNASVKWNEIKNEFSGFRIDY